MLRVMLVNGDKLELDANRYRIEETDSFIGAGVPTEAVFLKDGPKWYNQTEIVRKIPFHAILWIE